MILGLLALALHGAPAQPPVDIRWEGPAACIDEVELARQVVELAGEPTQPIGLEASSSAAGWTIDVTYGDTVRTVEAEDCGVLTEAVALIIAVRIDAVRTATKVEPEVEDEPEPPPKPEPLPVVAPEPVGEPEPPSRSPARPELQPTVVLGVGGSLGTLPRAGVSLRADAGVRRRALEVDVGVAVALGPRSTPREGVDAAFRLFAGLAQACWVLESGSVQAPLCGRAEVGVLQARPRGLERPNDQDALWLAPALRAGLAPSRGRFAPEGFVEVASPILRHRFEVADPSVGVLHRLPPVVVRLGIALRWRGPA